MPQSAISPDFTEIPAIENFIEFVRVFSFLLMSCKGLLAAGLLVACFTKAALDQQPLIGGFSSADALKGLLKQMRLMGKMQDAKKWTMYVHQDQHSGHFVTSVLIFNGCAVLGVF